MRPARVAGGAFALAAVVGLLSCRGAPPLSRDFEQDRELDGMGWSCRTLLRLSDKHATSGTKSLEVEFFPDPAAAGGDYPGFSFGRFDGNWSGRASLAFDAYNPADRPVRLGIRIDDLPAPPFADRFNASQPLAPGRNRVVLQFPALVTSGTGRPLDLRRITSVTLFVPNPKERVVLFFDRVALE